MLAVLTLCLSGLISRNLEPDLENLPGEISILEIHVQLKLDTSPCKSRLVDIRRDRDRPEQPTRGRSQRLDAYGRTHVWVYAQLRRDGHAACRPCGRPWGGPVVRRKGRPRRLAEAPKQGPDRKSLVKVCRIWRGLFPFSPVHLLRGILLSTVGSVYSLAFGRCV